MMGALETAAEIAKRFEGFRAKPYLCPAGVPTIGYGSTLYETGRKVSLADAAIDEIRATELLRWELRRSMAAALRFCPVLATNEDRLAAITDFVYNLGAGRLQVSTLRRRINQQNWPEVRKELLRWVRAKGKILPGLVARRTVEAGLI
ncbi:MAG TPA: lysozyme [Syntrophales bacterium]|nr:lysozyme [Syntrophales bacterium]HRR41796.1 lysozyme [Syntrophales bacterium]